MKTMHGSYLYEVPQLARTRSYASKLLEQTPTAAAAAAVSNLRTHGMCVLDNVIPPDRVEAVREEVDRVTREATGEMKGRSTHKEQAEASSQNLIARMPLFREFLAHPVVLDVARQMLDDHVRMAQINLRTIRGDSGSQKGGVAWAATHTRHSREWHTDWPHDLNAYGGDNAERNAGAIRQPFPGVRQVPAPPSARPVAACQETAAHSAVSDCLRMQMSACACQWCGTYPTPDQSREAHGAFQVRQISFTVQSMRSVDLNRLRRFRFASIGSQSTRTCGRHYCLGPDPRRTAV